MPQPLVRKGCGEIRMPDSLKKTVQPSVGLLHITYERKHLDNDKDNQDDRCCIISVQVQQQEQQEERKRQQEQSNDDL
jgi:hypothetical protein